MTSDTITGGLGIPDEFHEKGETIVKNALPSNSSISDFIIAVTKEVREESLGECNVEISEYEKKLIYSGFISGIKVIEHSMNKKRNEILGGFLGSIFNKSED